MKWKDVSSYSQSDKERIPNAFQANAGIFKLSIHRHIHYEKDDWLLSCEPFATTVISRGTLEEAQKLAVEFVLSKLRAAVAALEK